MKVFPLLINNEYFVILLRDDRCGNSLCDRDSAAGQPPPEYQQPPLPQSWDRLEFPPIFDHLSRVLQILNSERWKHHRMLSDRSNIGCIFHSIFHPASFSSIKRTTVTIQQSIILFYWNFFFSHWLGSSRSLCAIQGGTSLLYRKWDILHCRQAPLSPHSNWRLRDDFPDLTFFLKTLSFRWTWKLNKYFSWKISTLENIFFIACCICCQLY